MTTTTYEPIERAAEIAYEPAAIHRRAGLALLARLEDNDRFLRECCESALALAAPDRPLPSKAAWLLDHYTSIRAQIREVRDALPKVYYRDLPRMLDGPFRGHPRVYRLAAEVLARTDSEIDLDNVTAFLIDFQRFVPLLLAEVWAIGPALKLALIERLRAALEDPSADESGVRSAILNLRALEPAPWRDFVESISVVEEILREDPAGCYAQMDFETRDAYRHAVENIARRSRASEPEVAWMAVELALEADSGGDPRKAHVGFYLTGPGRALLKRGARYRAPLRGRLRDAFCGFPNAIYLGGMLLLTALVLAGAWRLAAPAPLWLLALLLIPASQLAVAALNPLVNFLVPPRRLPRMDFSKGIPDDRRTFVIVPTLLLSRAGVERLLERLEIHFLGNRDPNLLFALLTDLPDSPYPYGHKDHLLDVCAEGIRLLNERYRSEGSPFYLFHRDRVWNESEGVWMGHERKRGKLEDFNRLLLGEADAFSLKIGDLSALPTVRYVITLDSDTQLPRDTARKLIATMAHPLNRAIIDPATKTVHEGYAILQPRVSVSMESAARSRLARIYSGQTGFDPYTTAVSDVYQDLHGQASFTGKGIYDLRAFHAVVGGRFPENALLSHDLIEGEHAHTGLVTDLEFIDDYPGSYQAYCKRKHRWVRGDWQVAQWLLRRVPAAGPGRERNPLPRISRWKIADNLRRSLFEISLLLLLVCGWFALPGSPFFWTLLALGFLFAPAYIELGWALVRLPPLRMWKPYCRETAFRFANGHLDAALGAVFLAHQACLMTDAIVRTLVRLGVTRRKLLEWESMAQAEETASRRKSLVDRYLLAAVPFAALAALLLPGGTPWDALGFVVLELWMAAPLVARWLNGPPAEREGLREGDADFLRDAALQTWRYFRDFSTPGHNWLIPDNVQEDPPKVASRTSPTNIGLLLTANLAAQDFGYLTLPELTERVAYTFETLKRLETYRGHFYNWYDTESLRPLAPAYVSAVDSGNLAASLIALKQGCLELPGKPLLEANLLNGLRDHCLRLRNALPPGAQTSSVMRLIVSLVRQLEYRPTDLFCWESELSEAGSIARRLREPLEWACSKLDAEQAAEVRYWYGALIGRIEAALRYLYECAPWLAAPFEQEFRSWTRNSSLHDLVAALERVPSPAELPERYEAIANGIRVQLETPGELHPAMEDTLRRLVEELEAARARACALNSALYRIAVDAGRLAEEMDFAFLFDPKRKLLRVGYDAAAAEPDPAYYDLLASEARTAVFLAIAKGDAPREAWFHLGRKLTSYQGNRTLLSWSGTIFEYLMPCLHMRAFERTLLGESLKTIVRIQQLYGRRHGVPWGISEAAYGARDSALNYQYQAFGIPEVSLKGGLPDDLVIAPYASMLALLVDPGAAAANLREMDARGWRGPCGFYESVDYRQQGCTVVRAFMAHHQGMGLLALANALLGAPMQNRFHADPLVQATEFLLQERVPLLPPAGAEEPVELQAAYRRWKAAELSAQAGS